MKKTVLFGLVLAFTATGTGSSPAQVLWDGTTDSNNSGNWSVLNHWSGDALPTTSDGVILPSVSNGSTRTITQDISGGATVNYLEFAQSGATGVNKLSLGGNLSLSAPSNTSGSAFRVALSGGATASQVQVDLNGYSIISTTANSSSGFIAGGTVNFNSAGSSMITSAGGHSLINVSGILNASADGRLGRDTGGTSSTGNMTMSFLSGSQVNVTSGTFSLEVAGRRSQDRSFTLTNSGAISVSSGATLAQVWTAPANASNTASIAMTNQSTGTVTQAGSMAYRVHRDPASASTPGITLTNNGAWTVSGTNAVIRRLTTAEDSTYIAVPAFTNSASGTLKGSGGSDTLEFNEEVSTSARMTITNHGTITPGNGTSGSGLASVGNLVLRDINVTTGSGSQLNMDFGGSAVGQYDRLTLQTGVTDPAGAGTLDLSATGDILNLFTVNSYLPGLSFSVDLITAGSVVGAFDSVTLDSLAFTSNQLTVTEGTYTLSYTPTAVNLSFSAVPEPSTWAMMAGRLRLLSWLRRRRS